MSNEAKLHLYGPMNKAREQQNSRMPLKMETDDGQDQLLLLPDFLEMTSVIIDKANLRIKTQQKVVIGSTVLPFSASVYTQVLNYLRMCLIYNAGVVPHFDMLRDVHNEAPKGDKKEMISIRVECHNYKHCQTTELEPRSGNKNVWILVWHL